MSLTIYASVLSNSSTTGVIVIKLLEAWVWPCDVQVSFKILVYFFTHVIRSADFKFDIILKVRSPGHVPNVGQIVILAPGF